MPRFRVVAGWLLFLSLAFGPDACLLPSASAADAAASVPSGSQGSGVWYEIFVRAWYDTNGDGIGDLNGVTAKLDYLKSLGVSGIWLMPINASPSYHGYDVTDYEAINPQYGTLADFRHLVDEAHKRGIQVIIDLVINHTSDKHPWFVDAMNPNGVHRHWYTWATPDTDLKAMSATDSPAWHTVGEQSYLGDFSRGMPDLNYDDLAVRKEMIAVGQFWLTQGADGFRLDAARHIYDDLKTDTGKPATTRKNVAWWSQFREGLQQVRPDVYLVGEVTMPSPEALAPYLKPLGSVFDFPLATQLIASAKAEKNDGLSQLLEKTYAAFRQAAPGQFVDAPFLSNHDQERVFSQLDGQLDHMRVAAAMLLTLPGRPFIYYGEELGMLGRKPDPNVREPMRWGRAADEPGESRWKASSTGQGGAVSVAAEQDDPQSLLATYRMLIHWREQEPALRDGDIRLESMQNPHLVAYERFVGEHRVLVIHNLSSQAQQVDLADKSAAYRSIELQTGKATLQGRHLALTAFGTVVLQ